MRKLLTLSALIVVIGSAKAEEPKDRFLWLEEVTNQRPRSLNEAGTPERDRKVDQCYPSSIAGITTTSLSGKRLRQLRTTLSMWR
jgi:hypothetical protein